MRQPKYQLRMDADLLRRLTEAGTTRVREVLERAFPVVPGTTQDAPPVLPDPVSGTTQGVNIGAPVASGSTGSSSPVVPAWKAKLNEQIDKAKALKAARE